jgi:hypothetical protein
VAFRWLVGFARCASDSAEPAATYFAPFRVRRGGHDRQDFALNLSAKRRLCNTLGRRLKGRPLVLLREKRGKLHRCTPSHVMRD